MLDKIISFSIRHKWLVISVAALIAAGGVFAVRSLPMDAFPDVTSVQVEVVTTASGKSPLEIEKLVTYQVENSLRGIPGLTQLRSTSRYGLSVVTAVFKDGTRTFHAMSKEQVEQVRDKSRGYQMAKKYGKESPWDTHFIPMGLKTLIRRLCNLLPKSPELAMALAMDDLNERGETQNIGIAEAIDGSWAPIIDDEPEDQDSGGQGQGDKDSGPGRSAASVNPPSTVTDIFGEEGK